MDYQDKYLKYKMKYLELKKLNKITKQLGGNHLNIPQGTIQIKEIAYEQKRLEQDDENTNQPQASLIE